MDDLQSRLAFLQAAFERRALRVPWVRAVWETEEHRFESFQLGRPPQLGNFGELLDPELQLSATNLQIYNELDELTECSGSLVAEIVRSDRYDYASAGMELVYEGLRDLFEVEVWSRLLLELEPACFRYVAAGARESHQVLFGGGRVTAWIDNYPRTCAKVLKQLEARLLKPSFQQQKQSVWPTMRAGGAEQLVEPFLPLTGWPEILEALNEPHGTVVLKNTEPSRTKVRKLNEEFNGPIIFPKKRGAHPRADKSQLMDWWNGLREHFLNRSEEGEREEASARATVGETYRHGHSGIVVPPISGHVKKSRKPSR